MNRVRIFHIITLCLGLTLVVYSCVEIVRVRHYCSVVKMVQAETEERIRVLRESLRKNSMNVLMAMHSDGELSELDAVASLEKGWWIVFGIGVAVLAIGSASLVIPLLTRTSSDNIHISSQIPLAPDS